VLRTFVAVLVMGSLVGAVMADPIPPRFRRKEDHLRKLEEDRKHANDKPPFQFSAPEGLTVGPPPLVPDAPYPDFYASSPAATMIVFVEKGPVVINDELVDAQVKKQTDKFTAAHDGGSCKLIKKELVKLDDVLSATRVVLETRADANKKTKPMREIHYLVGNATHHAHVKYVTSPQNQPKLEKKFDASLRNTTGLVAAGAVAKPVAAATPADDRKPAP